MKRLVNLLAILSIFVSMGIMLACTARAGEAPKTEPVVATQTVESIGKERLLMTLASFLEMTKTTLQDGVELAKDGAVEAGKFAKVQVPLLLQELVFLRRAEVTAYFIATILVMLVGHYLASKLWKVHLEDEAEYLARYKYRNTQPDVAEFLSIILRIFCSIIPVIVILVNMRDWILPWVAPKIYLIEYTVNLVKMLR